MTSFQSIFKRGEDKKIIKKMRIQRYDLNIIIILRFSGFSTLFIDSRHITPNTRLFVPNDKLKAFFNL